jgi:hypothetical protein
MAPQGLEKIESGPENGMVSEASKPQDVVHGRVADCALRRLTKWRLGSSEENSHCCKGGKFSGLQSIDKATPNNYRIDWTEMPLPSLRGALATKQSRGRVMRPLDCSHGDSRVNG